MRPLTYVRTLVNTFTSAEYYREVLVAPFWFSFRFFLISLIILSSIDNTHLLTKVVPKIEKTVAVAVDESSSNFPDQLVIEWDGQQLQSSISPLTIPYPSSIEREEFNLPSNLLILDTSQTSLQASHLSNTDSLFAVSATNFYINTREPEWQTILLSDLLPKNDPFVVTKDSYPTAVTMIVTELTAAKSMILFIVVAAQSLLLIIGSFIIVAFESGVVYVMTQIFGLTSLKYRNIFTVSLHLIIPAQVVQKVADYVFQVSDIPIVGISYWVLFCYVLLTNREWLLKHFAKKSI